MTVLEAIEKINKDKQERRIYPYHALNGTKLQIRILEEQINREWGYSDNN